MIEFDMPQLRGLPDWRSEVRGALAGKSEELTRSSPAWLEMYARGLSMRDIEAAFADAGGRCALSRSAAGAVCERLRDEHQAFARRDLTELDIVYLFLDGVAERLHLGQPREAVLGACVLHADETPVAMLDPRGGQDQTSLCLGLRPRSCTRPWARRTGNLAALIAVAQA